MNMNKLILFRVATFVFGLIPSAFLCMLAYMLVEQFIRYPTPDNVIQFLVALGGFAGTMGFALTIFCPKRYRMLTAMLLAWGIISITVVIGVTPPDAIVGVILFTDILCFGVVSLVVVLTTQYSSSKELQQSSGVNSA